MKARGRLFKRLVVFMLLISFTANSVLLVAASGNIVIRSIIVDVESNGDLSYPTITTSNRRYSITEQGDWSKDEDELKAGDKITCTILIEPEEDNEIRLSDGRNSIKIHGAILKSYNRSGSKYKLTLEYIVTGRQESPEEAWWDEDEPWWAIASEIPNAKKYEFVLYRGSKKIASSGQINKEYYNFAKELAKYGVCEEDNVYFEVRVIYENEKSDYTASEEFWDWNELWYYCKDNNIEWNKKNSSSTSNSSNNSSNTNYTTVPNVPVIRPETPGYWVKSSEYWYYWNTANKQYATGWIVYQGDWYYLNNQGVAYTYWHKIGDKWYYFYPRAEGNFKECEMACDTWIGSYHVNSNGEWDNQR